ncbi:MAG: hypothetical protein DWQ01_22750 [Planctomycetota bacterium]|nr:MAG: hypothetical protein DWQ01_22750 [Planctomycetota bacterium]
MKHPLLGIRGGCSCKKREKTMFMPFLFLLFQIPGGAWNTGILVEEPNPSPGFGTDHASGSDVDLDGIPDILVGDRVEVINGNINQGAAYLFSGSTGNLIHRIEGELKSELFGESMAMFNDLNSDGIPDFAVGASGDFLTRPGRVSVFCGASGNELYRLYGHGLRDKFGKNMSRVGDVNGDGFDDFIVGAHQATPYLNTEAGEVGVFSGLDGSLIYHYEGGNPYDSLGFQVGGLGDVNGDGIPDFGAMDLSSGSGGAVIVASGSTGEILYRIEGTAHGEMFGSMLEEVGDTNMDGCSDFLVGAPWYPVGQEHPGAAYLISGMDGSVLHLLVGDSEINGFFGESGTGIEDLDGDGLRDFAVGDTSADVNQIRNTGSVYFYSGRDGALIYQMTGEEGELMGKSITTPPPGRTDLPWDVLIYTRPPDLPPGEPNPGAIGAFSFDPFLQISRNRISASEGGAAVFQHDFPDSQAGFEYRLLMSTSERGITTYNGLDLPLAPSWQLKEFAYGQPAGFTGRTGFLNTQGRAQTTLGLLPGTALPVVGYSFTFASVTLDPNGQPSLSSAPVYLTIDP